MFFITYIAFSFITEGDSATTSFVNINTFPTVIIIHVLDIPEVSPTQRSCCSTPSRRFHSIRPAIPSVGVPLPDTYALRGGQLFSSTLSCSYLFVLQLLGWPLGLFIKDFILFVSFSSYNISVCWLNINSVVSSTGNCYLKVFLFICSSFIPSVTISFIFLLLLLHPCALSLWNTTLS